MLVIRRNGCPHLLHFTITITITTIAILPQQAQSSALDTWYIQLTHDDLAILQSQTTPSDPTRTSNYFTYTISERRTLQLRAHNTRACNQSYHRLAHISYFLLDSKCPTSTAQFLHYPSSHHLSTISTTSTQHQPSSTPNPNPQTCLPTRPQVQTASSQKPQTPPQS
jgi:hypothetical protein